MAVAAVLLVGAPCYAAGIIAGLRLARRHRRLP